MSKNDLIRRWRDIPGAFADVGVLFPIAVSLVLLNGLSATYVLLPAGLLYVYVAYVYRVPVAVQPLKAFGALAIAHGVGPDVIASGALILGGIFCLGSFGGVIDKLSSWVPQAVVRGVQLSVGLLLLKIAVLLVLSPPSFSHDVWGGDSAVDRTVAVTLAVTVLILSCVFRSQGVAMVWALVCCVAVVAYGHGVSVWGPSDLHLPMITPATLTTAAVLLVLPQLPLTFANACVASAEASRQYFGDRATAVTPGRLARSLGTANVFAAFTSGMPVCHGAGGVTAHYSFGARTWRAPLTIGVTLLALALLCGREFAELCAYLPLPVLAGLIATTALLHVWLLRDLSSPRDWCLALGVGVAGFAGYLAAALVVGSCLHWVARRLHQRRSSHT